MVIPRRLVDLCQIPDTERPAVIAEGMRLLAEHASAMAGAAKTLREAHPQSLVSIANQDKMLPMNRVANLLDAVAIEEIGSFFILVDLARTGVEDASAIKLLARRFTRHLAKGIYANMAADGFSYAHHDREQHQAGDYKRPQTTFYCAQCHADELRIDRHLDGPNEVDFVFRNSIEADREDALYVDYVQEEDGHHWITPSSQYGTVSYYDDSLELMNYLVKMGAACTEGVSLLNQIWSAHRDRWSVDEPAASEAPSECRKSDEVGMRGLLNQQTVAEFVTRSLADEDLGEAAASFIITNWSAPLNGVEMDSLKLTDEEIEERRQSWVAEQDGSLPW